jgi:adenosine deaminase
VDIDDIDKCELHLHLEGSLRPATLARLADRHGIALSESELESRFEFADFESFVELFSFGLRVLRTAEDFRDAVVALADELASQRVRYAEVTTTWYSHAARGVPDDEYVAGLNEGRAVAWRDHGVELGWILDIPREQEPPGSTATADFVLGSSAPEGVVAIGCGGVEVGFGPELFAEAFAKVSAAGLGSVVHAGETGGPDSIRAALDAGRASRIGHGVRAVEDAALLTELVERGVPLEVCPTSNVLLGVAPSLAGHPIVELVAAGAYVTVNTDDPPTSGSRSRTSC